MFEIVVPIRVPDVSVLEKNYTFYLEEYSRFEAEVKNLPNTSNLLQVLGRDQTLSSIEIKVLNRDILEQTCTSQLIEELDYTHSFLGFKHPLTLSYLNLTCHIHEDYDHNVFLFEKSLAEELITKLSFLFNLTYQVSIRFLNGIVYEDDDILSRTDAILDIMDMAYAHADYIKWPKFVSLDIETVIKWFIENGVSLDNVSNTKAGRAINALSYTFINHPSEKHFAQLFWAMVGIEALFAVGDAGIQQQIKSKIALVLD